MRGVIKALNSFRSRKKLSISLDPYGDLLLTCSKLIVDVLEKRL